MLLLVAGGCFWYTRTQQNKDTAHFSKSNPNGNPSGYSSETIDYKNSGKEYIAALYVEGIIEDANSTPLHVADGTIDFEYFTWISLKATTLEALKKKD